MSKMIKLLALVAVVATIALPSVLLAQATPAPAAPAPISDKGEKPYSNGDAVWTWDNVSGSFTHGDNSITVKGFTVKRAVTSDPVDTTFYYKENASFWTWTEGYAVTAPTAARDLGFFTYRPPKAPKAVTPPPPPAPGKGKIYKAYAPVAPAAPREVSVPPAPKTGWKRGEEPVRSK